MRSAWSLSWWVTTPGARAQSARPYLQQRLQQAYHTTCKCDMHVYMCITRDHTHLAETHLLFRSRRLTLLPMAPCTRLLLLSRCICRLPGLAEYTGPCLTAESLTMALASRHCSLSRPSGCSRASYPKAATLGNGNTWSRRASVVRCVAKRDRTGCTAVQQQDTSCSLIGPIRSRPTTASCAYTNIHPVS